MRHGRRDGFVRPPRWEVALDQAVAKPNGPPRVRRDVFLVRDQDDRLSGGMELVQHPHDAVSGLRVEIPGWLVGEDDRGVVHQGARDGDALPLSARQLVRAVLHPIREPHLLEGSLGTLPAFTARDPGVDER